MICNLCGREPALYEHEAEPFTVDMVAFGFQVTRRYDDESWSVCATCSGLIWSGSLDALGLRVTNNLATDKREPLASWEVELSCQVVKLVAEHLTGEWRSLSPEAA